MEELRISDKPSIRKLLEEARSFEAIKQALPLLQLVLNLFDIDIGEIDDPSASGDKLIKLTSELASIPDRFNDLFASRAWIAYEFLDFEVAKAAVEKAEAGYIDDAETDLVNYYSTETVKWHLQKMKYIEAFRPRMQLAQKALIDYEEKRYHACIPVVLALLDGLVNEVQDKHRGFFANGVDLTAWDSISAHSKGLNELSRILKLTRPNTVTDQITVPYRNGIMHGTDLGYDNKMVAAKTWAALFAVRDWASKAERGLLKAQPEKPQPTWEDIFDHFQKSSEVEEWQKREIRINTAIPETENPDVFESGTPERKLVEFLTLWKARNYGYMALCLDPKFGASARKNIGVLRGLYGQAALHSFSLTQVDDYAPACTKIFTNLVYMKDGELESQTTEYLLTNADDKGEAQVRGTPDSQWGIVNWEWIYF